MNVKFGRIHLVSNSKLVAIVVSVFLYHWQMCFVWQLSDITRYAQIRTDTIKCFPEINRLVSCGFKYSICSCNIDYCCHYRVNPQVFFLFGKPFNSIKAIFLGKLLSSHNHMKGCFPLFS